MIPYRQYGYVYYDLHYNTLEKKTPKENSMICKTIQEHINLYELSINNLKIHQNTVTKIILQKIQNKKRNQKIPKADNIIRKRKRYE